ncbi:DUF4238 domain-containing protein [Bifidobacterium tibiigranuli]|jgi:hypothetical protein|nr:DUF4238 domain-containing protein [Bifidobacterium tibiigranuli]
MIPRSYLDGWADGKGMVDVADLAKGRSTTTAIINATVVSYAYRTEILSTDLEGQFAKVESAGISALRKLRRTDTLTQGEIRAAIAFLDMYRERGLYADQAKTQTPAVLLMQDRSLQEAELSLGDRMVLASYMNETVEFDQLGIETWPWSIWDCTNALTGDGALTLWREANSTAVTTITFPLSPTKILVIGRKLSRSVDINLVTVLKSRRWLIAQRGMFDEKKISLIAKNHNPGPLRWISLKEKGISLDLEVS